MRGSTLLLVVLLLAPGIQAEDQRPKPKAATTEEALKYLLEAAKTDDLAGFQSQLGAHSHAMMQMARATDAYFAALDEKFGKSPKSRFRPSAKSILVPFKTRKYQVRNRVGKDEKHVELTVWEVSKGPEGNESIQEETWTSIKESSGWKIVLPPKGVIREAVRTDENGKEVKIRILKTQPFNTEKSAREAKMWREAEQILHELTKEIKDGKFANRKEAEAALRKSKERLQK